MRIRIEMTDTPADMLLKMCEGNIGALSVLTEIMINDVYGFLTALHLDDMNIRGPQIWIGYKDYAREDLGKFIEAVKSRDPEMVALINREYKDEVAVTSGASSNDRGFI